MDFPHSLTTKQTFVSRRDEFEQSVTILLKNIVGSFCQAFNVGSYYSIHSSSASSSTNLVDVRKTLEELQGVNVLNVQQLDDTHFDVTLTYNGEEIHINA